MKNFNVSRQSPKSSQAWKKEYVYRLQQEADSLYYYLHYYNPSWKLITKSQGYVGYTPCNSKDVYKDNLLNTTKNYMDVSNINWSSDFMDVSLITDKYASYDGYVVYVLDYETGQVGPQDYVNNEVFTSIYLQAGTYVISDDNSSYVDYDDYTHTGGNGYPIACIRIGSDYYGFGTSHQQITIPQNGMYDVTINFPKGTESMYKDELWLQIATEEDDWVAYGTPVAPTSSGICRQALAFRWGVKNTTGSPQYINYAEYGTYKRLNTGATLFKIDASDSADWIHYMIFEGALAQYYTQSYSFNYNSSTSKMDVTITNHLINAATKGLSYPTQFTRVPPRYFYQGLSLIPLKYLNNGAVVDKIYDNNNRITNDGQTIIQQWGENSDVCMDVFANHQGENLCVAADISERVINGVTWRVEDQVYYLNGTPTKGSWQHPGQPIVHLEPGTYTVYYYTNSTDPEVYTHIGYGFCDRTNPDVNMWYRLNNEKMTTFTISAAMDCYIIFWWGPSTLPEGKTFDNVWVRTAVYKGAPGYEPLFADTMIATSNSSTQQFKPYLDKTQAERKPTEDFFKIIVY